MITWPAFMPEPQLDSYNYKRHDIVVRTELETGRMRMRRRSADGPTRVGVSWIMTREEFAYFEGWFLNKVLAGAAPFTMAINVGAGGCVDHECRFMDSYTMTGLVRGDLYRVSAPLEIKQLSVYDANTIAVIDAYGDLSAYGDFLDLFEIFVNQDLPNSTSMGA